MTKPACSTMAPVPRNRPMAATAVPPVAIRSSISSTLCPARQHVGVDLDGVNAVFERIVLPDGGAGQLAALADRHEADAHLDGDARAEDEAARLDAGDMGDAGVAMRVASRRTLSP